MIVDKDGLYAQWVPGKRLRYCKDGHTDDVIVDNVTLSDDDLCIRYSIRLTDGRLITCTKEFLRDLEDE